MDANESPASRINDLLDDVRANVVLLVRERDNASGEANGMTTSLEQQRRHIADLTAEIDRLGQPPNWFCLWLVCFVVGCVAFTLGWLAAGGPVK